MRFYELLLWLRTWRRVGVPEPPRRLWLTLDDGPDPVVTDPILKALDRHGIKATFFVIGQRVEQHEAIVGRIVERGHRIGNHSYSHPRLTELSDEAVHDELARTDRLIERYVDGDKLFRPPYGAHDERIDGIAAALGYRTVLWDVDPSDWAPAFQSKAWVAKALWQIQNGQDAIVLNHDNQKTTADHYDWFIERTKAIGAVTFAPPSSL